MAVNGLEAQIAHALLKRLQAMTLSPPLPVAYPDVNFTKPASGMWLETSLFQAPTTGQALGFADSNSYSGFMQLTVVSPQNVGVIATLQIVAAICLWFQQGTKMWEGSTRIEIVKNPYSSSLIMDPPYTRTPITIPYQVYALQPA